MFSKDLKMWQRVNRWLEKSNREKNSSMLTEMSLGIYIQEGMQLSALIIYKFYPFRSSQVWDWIRTTGLKTMAI